MKEVRLQIGIPRAGSSAKAAEERSRQDVRLRQEEPQPSSIKPSSIKPITMRATTGRTFKSMAEMEAAARGEVWKAIPDPVVEVPAAVATPMSQPRNENPANGLLRSIGDRLQSLFRSTASPDSGNGPPPTQR